MESDGSVRYCERRDFGEIVRLFRLNYPNYPESEILDEQDLARCMEIFPQGAFVAEKKGKVLGAVFSMVINDIGYGNWYEATGNCSLSTHDRLGDTLYIQELFVHPRHENNCIGKKLMQKQIELTERLKLKQCLSPSRIPGYHLCSRHLTIDEYLRLEHEGMKVDKVLAFYQKLGFEPKAVKHNYFYDPPSHNYCVEMVKSNPFYRNGK